MAKRWINSVDVFVDDQGRIGITFPSELVQDNRLKVDAQQDTEAITGPPPYARTLADLYDRLEYGLCNSGLPWMDIIHQSIHNDFYYFLYNPNSYQPWLQTIYNNIEMIHNEVWMLRVMFENVYDATQHALRTV